MTQKERREEEEEEEEEEKEEEEEEEKKEEEEDSKFVTLVFNFSLLCSISMLSTNSFLLYFFNGT